MICMTGRYKKSWNGRFEITGVNFYDILHWIWAVIYIVRIRVITSVCPYFARIEYRLVFTLYNIHTLLCTWFFVNDPYKILVFSKIFWNLSLKMNFVINNIYCVYSCNNIKVWSHLIRIEVRLVFPLFIIHFYSLGFLLMTCIKFSFQ